MCSGNTIGGSTFGITINDPTANGASNNYGIIASSAGSATTATIDSNSISNITHYTSSVSTARVHAINISYPTTSTIAVTNNTIGTITSNMKSNTANAYATTLANSGSNVIGIITTTGTSTISINNNTISNLSNTGVNGSLTPSVLGIAIDGASTNTISRNKIYGLSNQSPGSAANSASIIGIRLYSGTNTVTNNMITITNGSNTNASRIVGVWDNSSSHTMHYNSIVIGGSQTAGGTNGLCSAPYACLLSSGTRDFKNNILVNSRTGGTSGTTSFHYALAIPTTGSTITSNYNDLVAADLTKLCLYNATSYTIAAWQALGTPATPDVNSIAITPTFIDSTNGDLHIKPDFSCVFDNKGIAVATTTDYDLDPSRYRTRKFISTNIWWCTSWV